MKAHSEEAFEELIEHHLLAHGYVSRPYTAYNIDLALIEDDLLDYVASTQPKTWKKQQAIHGNALRTNFLAAFDKATADVGVIHILRHGFKFYGSTIRVATFETAFRTSTKSPEPTPALAR